MSDHYKLIVKAREYMLNIKSDKGFTVTDLMVETGLAHTLVCDILENDPVSIRIREASVVKLREFIDKQEMVRVEPKPTKSVINKGDASAFSVIEVPESMKDAVPKETEIERDPDRTENLLNDLTKLADRFRKQGYRLNISIDLITTF